MSHAYRFVTTWRLPATPEEITAILGDARRLPQWWPSVYLDVQETVGPDGTKVVHLWTKGWLPYTLKWSFVVTERRDPFGFSLRATGDFVGRGDWTFRPDGDATEVEYRWEISAEKPLLRWLSWLMKPLFSANHHWAMAKGRESLELELRRRRPGADPSTIPAPPPPTWPHRAAGLLVQTAP